MIPKLQAILTNEKLDALLLTGEVSRRYATGFHTSAGLVLITPGECLFITDFRYIEAARARVRGYRVEMCDTKRTARAIALEALAALGAVQLGFEGDTMTVETLQAWQKAAPELIFKPAHKAVRELRLVKSESEAAAVTAAQRIAERALDEVINTVIAPGLTENQVCAEIIYRIYQYGADALAFAPIVVSGPNSALPHGEPGERRLQPGDFITMDIGAQKDGYCSDMTRTVALGHADDEMRRVYDIVLRAQQAGIAATRAGVTGESIDGAAREIIKAEGYGENFGHSFGHGVGLEIHEAPTLGAAGTNPLTAGAIVTAEPGIYLPGRFGVRIEDMLYVTETGSRNLTEMPKELVVVPV